LGPRHFGILLSKGSGDEGGDDTAVQIPTKSPADSEMMSPGVPK
jgi:hypothetical protein